jgi:hypothetical protein
MKFVQASGGVKFILGDGVGHGVPEHIDAPHIVVAILW